MGRSHVYFFRTLSEVSMSQPMQLIKSRIEEIEDLGQPIESPKPPPPTINDFPRTRPRTPVQSDEDPYHPEKYKVEIFRLMEETIDGETKSARFTVLDNAIDVIREQLDIYGYAIYTLLYH